MVPYSSPAQQIPPAAANCAVPAVPPRDRAALVRDVRRMDRLSFLRQILLRTRSVSVVPSLLASYRASSQHQQVAWKAFQAWLPPLVTDINRDTVLSFLQHLFQQSRLAPSTIMSYRASLVWPLHEAFGVDFSHPDFSQIAKGFFHLRPPAPKTVPQWDLEQVLKYYESLESVNLTPRLKFFKALFLTALASGNRCSELAHFSRTGILFRSSGVTIPVLPRFLYKNQTIHRTPAPVSFTVLSGSSLCPVAALQDYITSSTRPPNSSHLFLNPTTSKPLTAGRLGYWLVQAIRQAGMQKNVIKPHDVRKFAYSVSWARCTPIADILSHGFWASLHPFLRNYLQHIPNVLPHFVAAGSVSHASISTS